MQVSRVTPESVGYVWQQILPMVERALAHGAGDCTSADHVLAAIQRGDNELWAIHRSSKIVAGLVISVQRHPAKTTLHVELCAGRDLDDWIEKIEGLLMEYRDLIGADTVEATCRAGLAKRLRKRGWGAKATIMELS